MGAKMRLTKAAREKLMKEAKLYEQTCYFILTFPPNKVLDVAYKNIAIVLRDLDVILSWSSSSSSIPLVDDVSSIINENRTKVENELVYICDKSYDIKTQETFKEFLVHFKQGDITKYRSKVYYSRYAPDDIKGKEKAPQLTELERKQQKDAEEKSQVHLEKLYTDSRDCDATLWFMSSFLRNEQVTNQEHRRLLQCAYDNIMVVHFDLQHYIMSDEVLCDKDMSLILDGYRSKVENELQGICDNVSNLTVQEAYTRYLDDFKTGLKLYLQDHSRLQIEDSNIMSSKTKSSVKKKKKKSRLRLRGKGGSGCKTPSLMDLRMNDYVREPRHDHRECCMKKNHLETYVFDRHRPIRRINKVPFELPTVVFPASDDDSS